MAVTGQEAEAAIALADQLAAQVRLGGSLTDSECSCCQHDRRSLPLPQASPCVLTESPCRFINPPCCRWRPRASCPLRSCPARSRRWGRRCRVSGRKNQEGVVGYPRVLGLTSEVKPLGQTVSSEWAGAGGRVFESAGCRVKRLCGVHILQPTATCGPLPWQLNARYNHPPTHPPTLSIRRRHNPHGAQRASPMHIYVFTTCTFYTTTRRRHHPHGAQGGAAGRAGRPGAPRAGPREEGGGELWAAVFALLVWLEQWGRRQ